MADIDGMKTLTQQMIDQVFSFGELGFQEIETSKYLTGVLRQNGFTIQEGVAGHSHRVGRDLGQRQARHRPRVRHRQPAADQPDARRAVTTSRSSRARPGTARATTPACR